MNLSRRAADYDPAGARRWVQFTLGLLWLADGLLQLQPFMFTRAFATQVLAPAATGNPGFVAGPVLAVARIVGHEPAAFNALFASIQLAIGLGLLWRRTVRAALVASIIWGLLVWSSGEGFGGILTSNPTPVTGAPGAAVLYVLISALTWPPGRCPRGGGPLGDWARPAWLAVWGSGAYFLLLAANQAPRALGSSLADAATGEPGWLAALDNGAAVAVGARGAAVSLGLAAVFAVIALGVFTAALARPVLLLAMATAVAIWLLGQGLGGILTGQGTDPNTGPLLVLLAVAYWPQGASRRRPSFAEPGWPDNRRAEAGGPSAPIRPGRHRASLPGTRPASYIPQARPVSYPPQARPVNYSETLPVRYPPENPPRRPSPGVRSQDGQRDRSRPPRPWP